MRLTLSRTIARAALLALVGALILPAVAVAQTATGALRGQVVDDTGGVLPGATVTVTNAATGLKRTDVTDEVGAFRFPALPPGDYAVKAELSNYKAVTVENVSITIATTRSLDITLSVAAVEESVTVTAEAPLVATSPAIGTTVSQDELANLPLNGRQFANLGVLAPGTALSYNNDPTKPGQLVIMLNGGAGRNVNYVVDGGDNTDDTIGGALQNYTLDSVQEFSIQTMQYKAEYGRSSGGVLAVVTKTGSNDLAGSVYGFFRSDSLNSRTESEKQAGLDKQDYDRKQYGASLGGPIVRDKAHFFVTAEKIDRETSYVVDSGGIAPSLDGKAFPLPFKDELATAKATWDIDARQYLQVRYGYQKNTDKYGASSVAAPDNLGTVSNKYSSILAGHTIQLGPDTLNEFVFQYTKFNNVISADSFGPNFYYPSGFQTGQNFNTPQTTNQTKYQYRDDLSFSKTLGGARHDFKVGVQYINEPTLGGDFSTGLNGQYAMLEDSADSPVASITIYGGFFGDSTPSKQYSAYLQDDWYASANLTVNIGLRYDYFDALHLDQRSNPIWQVLSTQTVYNESYLRDFQGGKGGVIENEKNDYAPRLGFTWDLKGNGRQLLRGGVGRFYDFPYSNATVLFPAGAVQSNYGVVYYYSDPDGIRNPDGSLYVPGQPLPPNQLTNPDLQPPNEIASPTLAPPYSDQVSLGYSWQANDWLGLNFEAVTIKYRHIPFRFRINAYDENTGQARFPQFGNFRLWYGNGKADYDGINIGVRVRKEAFELQGFYTYSKVEGNVLSGTDEFRLTDIDYQRDLRAVRDQSVCPLDPLCEAGYGPLNTDAKHRITLAGYWRGPWGVVVSGMYRYRSARAYTIWAGEDLNGDGFTFDLPSDVSHVGEGRGHSFNQFDLRVSKQFTFGKDLGLELIAEVFNLLNAKNPNGYIGNRLASNYGEPTAYSGSNTLQGEQRLAQLGLRVTF